MDNYTTSISDSVVTYNKPILYVSPVAMKPGDKIIFSGPQFDNPKDKAKIKELEDKNNELVKELETSKQCIIGILSTLDKYQQSLKIVI